MGYCDHLALTRTARQHRSEEKGSDEPEFGTDRTDAFPLVAVQDRQPSFPPAGHDARSSHLVKFLPCLFARRVIGLEPEDSEGDVVQGGAEDGGWGVGMAIGKSGGGIRMRR
jgi:hypothetical protein